MAPKLSKNDFSVNYRQAEPGSDHCGGCMLYNRAGTCTIVYGSIKRNFVCDKYAAKQRSGVQR